MPRKRRYDPASPRGTKGLGSVYTIERKRKNGTVRTIYCAALVYRDHLGQQHRLVGYGDSSEAAVEKLKALQDRPEVKSRLAPAKGSVGEFIESWIDLRSDIRPSTRATYEATFRAHIKPHAFAKVPLAKVSSADVEALNRVLRNAGVSDRTRRKVHDLLVGAFTKALTTKRIAEYPMRGVERPAYAAPPVQALAPEQIDAFLEAAEGDPLEALYVLTIFTGLRSGEVLALRWCDLDLKAAVLMVSSSLHDTGAKKKDKKPTRVIGAPKTDTSARSVKLSKNVVRALLAHRKAQGGDDVDPAALVFPNERGKPLWRQNLLRRSYYPLLERAGLVDDDGKPLLSFHDLRHVHGTELFRAGIHPKIVQERLGHSRIGITIDTYSSSIPGMQEAAVKAIDGAHAASRRRRSKTTGQARRV